MTVDEQVTRIIADALHVRGKGGYWTDSDEQQYARTVTADLRKQGLLAEEKP